MLDHWWHWWQYQCFDFSPRFSPTHLMWYHDKQWSHAMDGSSCKSWKQHLQTNTGFHCFCWITSMIKSQASLVKNFLIRRTSTFSSSTPSDRQTDRQTDTHTHTRTRILITISLPCFAAWDKKNYLQSLKGGGGGGGQWITHTSYIHGTHTYTYIHPYTHTPSLIDTPRMITSDEAHTVHTRTHLAHTLNTHHAHTVHTLCTHDSYSTYLPC